MSFVETTSITYTCNHCGFEQAQDNAGQLPVGWYAVGRGQEGLTDFEEVVKSILHFCSAACLRDGIE